jgi:hypothetical protein
LPAVREALPTLVLPGTSENVSDTSLSPRAPLIGCRNAPRRLVYVGPAGHEARFDADPRNPWDRLMRCNRVTVRCPLSAPDGEGHPILTSHAALGSVTGRRLNRAGPLDGCRFKRKEEQRCPVRSARQALRARRTVPFSKRAGRNPRSNTRAIATCPAVPS